MVKKKMGVVDRETGEILDGSIVAFFPRKRKNGFKNGWFSMSIDGNKAVLDANLTGAEYRVWNVLMLNVGYGNAINVTQADVAKVLGMHKQHVNKAFRKLVSSDLIRVYKKVGPVNLYQFNPEYLWRGSGDDHVACLSDERAKRLIKRGDK